MRQVIHSSGPRLIVSTLAVLATLIASIGSTAASQSTPSTNVRYEVLDLGTLGGANSRGNGLNAKGHVVGESELGATAGTPSVMPVGQAPPTVTFLWKDGQMINVGTLGGPTSRAASINDSDEIAGEADTADGNRHAFLWQNGKVTDLGTLGGDQSAAIGINNHGQITGLSTTAPAKRSATQVRTRLSGRVER